MKYIVAAFISILLIGCTKMSTADIASQKTDGIVLGYFVLNRKTDEIIHTEINENGIPVVYFEFSPSISLPEYKGWEFFMTENDFRYVARFALVKSDEPHS